MVKVLIVDDNDNNRLTLNLLLEDIAGVEVCEAEDGQVAVEMCVRQNFDLIFMDIMMPNMDGFEATKLIKQLQKNCMIIALSALDDQTSKNKMLSLGAEDYLTKPVDAELFNTRVRHYLRIIALRNKETSTTSQVLNPFDAKVYSRSTTFRIDKEEALGEFWDYWLKGEKNIIDLSDCVRLIYGFGLWLLKNEQSFTIVMEESSDKVYMMLLHQGAIKSIVIKNLLLKHFAQAKYILSKEMLSFQLDMDIKSSVEVKKESVEVSAEAKKILAKTHDNALCATEYIENTAISFMGKIDGLESINDETDKAILDFERSPSKRTALIICDNFQEYADVLEELVDFAHLGFAIQTLINFLTTLTEDQFEDTKVKKLSSMLLNLLHDLASWRENVFITQVARDVHYLDASLLSSCIQVEAIFEDKSADVSGDDEIEFF
ncbi:response regulator [Sulfurospirillum diekertiae]|uniref:Response regulator n=1 Tax=Sulfurospirillum diekertiae TaxID=1854492 RepID=A0A6G9VQ20_9BACT|nr:response regulator [Sulfurospirillum diekertiae]QIR75616.1 response regulator [Sulfurospirillum diekertiae]QIR78265.1 response regulator [Sulfurospirillum diekertiae]